MRRLPVSFTSVWDNWLQTSLQASRKHFGHLWLDTYLNSPIWRFALAPGVCGAQAWAGILMPSVDKVGRHFPLTIAISVSNPIPIPEWMEETGVWYDQLEELALSALRNDFDLAAFDVALSLIAVPPKCTVSSHEPKVSDQNRGHAMTLTKQNHLQVAVRQLSPRNTAAMLNDHSLWWTGGSSHIKPSVLIREGLPVASSFSDLLEGQRL